MRKKRHAWFVQIRGSYLPNSWQGWVCYVPFTGFLIAVLVSASQKETVADMVYLVFPQWVAATVVMTWVAAHKS